MFFGNYLQLDELGDNVVLEMNEFYRRIIGLMDWWPAFHTRPDTMLSSAQQPGTARFEIIPNLALLDLKLPHRETRGCMGLGYYILNGAWIKMLHIGQDTTIACLILHYCGPLWFKEGGYFPEPSLQRHECLNSNICRAWLGFNVFHR
jgi:hypothetical protein